MLENYKGINKYTNPFVKPHTYKNIFTTIQFVKLGHKSPATIELDYSR